MSNEIDDICNKAYQLARSNQGIQGAKQFLIDCYKNSNPAPCALAIGLVHFSCITTFIRELAIVYSTTENEMQYVVMNNKDILDIFVECDAAAYPHISGANFGDYQQVNNSNTAKGAAAGGIIGALLGGSLLGIGLSAVAGGIFGSTKKKEPDYDLFYSYVWNGIKEWVRVLFIKLERLLSKNQN